MERNNPQLIYDILLHEFPNACCELDYDNVFQLVIAVTLSAQTTDIAVNKVTKTLFSKYSTPYQLKNAQYEDVYNIIKPIGLAQNKTKNIIGIAKKIVDEYDGEVPKTLEELKTLPGVGQKTANVILSEGFKIPRIAVDTHVLRISNRLGLTASSNTDIIEKDLMKLYPEDKWHSVHLLLLFFGRYICKATNPCCENCPIIKANCFCNKNILINSKK